MGIWLPTKIWMDQNQEEVDELQKWWFGGNQITLLHHVTISVKVLPISCTILQSNPPSVDLQLKIPKTHTWIMFGGFFGILSQFYGSKMIRTCQQRVMWVPGNTSVVLSTLPCIRSCFLLTNRWDNHKQPADEPWPDPTGTAWMFFEKWLSIEELSNLQGGSWPIYSYSPVAILGILEQ